MTEDVDGILLTDGRSRIFLHPPEPYPDGHGFRHQVDLVGGPFCGTIIASSYESPALGSFHEELAAIYRNLKGEARLPQTYDNLKVSLKGDGLGHVTVHADAIALNEAHARLSFTFAIDQTQLPEIIAAVDRLFLKRLPRSQ